MNDPTHAGGVVFRRSGERLEYLVVRARAALEQWVFPKGHIEAGEAAEQAALREVGEEAGVTACVLAPVGTGQYATDREVVSVVYFLMAYVGETEPAESRERRWCSYDDARALLSFADARDVLDHADQALHGPGKRP